jgi:hypothetical protein
VWRLIIWGWEGDRIEIFGVNEGVHSKLRCQGEKSFEISRKDFALLEMYFDSVYVGGWSLRGRDVASVEIF